MAILAFRPLPYSAAPARRLTIFTVFFTQGFSLGRTRSYRYFRWGDSGNRGPPCAWNHRSLRLALVILTGGCLFAVERLRARVTGFATASRSGRTTIARRSGRLGGSTTRMAMSPSAPGSLAEWWHVMNDPILNGLIEEAYRQNLTLQQAGILEFGSCAASPSAICSQTPTSGRQLRAQVQPKPPTCRRKSGSRNGTAASRPRGNRFLGPLPPHIRGASATLDASIDLRRCPRHPSFGRLLDVVQLRTFRPGWPLPANDAHQMESLRVAEDAYAGAARARRRRIKRSRQTRADPAQAGVAQ